METNAQAMTERRLTDEERALTTAIVSRTGHCDAIALQAELAQALISHSSTWVCGVQVPDSTPVFDCPDGPVPRPGVRVPRHRLPG